MALLGPAISRLAVLLQARDPSLPTPPARPTPLPWPALQSALCLSYASPNDLNVRSVAETADLLALFRALGDLSEDEDREAAGWLCGLHAAVIFAS